MVSTRTRTAARKRVRKQLLENMQEEIELMTDFELIDPVARREKITADRDEAISKAEAEYAEKTEELDRELGELLVRMNELKTMQEIQDMTGISYSRQRTLRDLVENKSEQSEDDHVSETTGKKQTEQENNDSGDQANRAGSSNDHHHVA